MNELSEEEIIDIITGLNIDEYEWYLECNKYEGHNEEAAFIVQDAIQGLLDLYKQEKEKNKELENADLTSVYLDGVYDGEKKWKGKLKELIKEIDNDNTDESWWYINKIQELLQEKENNNG